MPDSTHPPFSLEGADLLASALHAQLIARRRATFEHDLKNLIHGLLSGSELLGKALATSSARIPPAECLALLQQQLGRAQGTLHGILEEVAPVDATAAEIDLAALIEECSHDLRHQLQRYELKTDIEPGLRVRARRVRLKDALLYTLLECMDHAPLRSALTLSVRSDGDETVIMELRCAVSAPQPETAFVIVTSLLDADGARFDVSGSATERCVSIRLPLVARPQAASASMRLLIVDANRDAADSLAMLLQLEGYHAEAAYDAASAVQAATAQKPEAVVLDLDIPLDTKGLLEQLRAAHPKVRIVGVGHGTEPHANVDAQLRKPLDTQALRTALG